MLTVRKGNTNTHNYLLFMSGLHTGHTHTEYKTIKKSKMISHLSRSTTLATLVRIPAGDKKNPVQHMYTYVGLP